MDDKVLKIVYTFFVGVMLALFVGFGVQTFYPEPEYPASMIYEVKPPPTPEEEQKYQDAQISYQNAIETYNRNVSIIATATAVAFMGLSLLLEKKNRVLTNGVMVGGLFTLLYGVGRGFASGDTTTTFITVTVGLAVVLFLGYRRFAPHDDAGPPPPGGPAPEAAAPAPPAGA